MQEIAGKQCYLIMIDSKTNHNKFYQMIENKNTGRLFAIHGRIGSKGIKREYPMTSWDKLYQEKISNGYEDKTEMYVATVTIKNDVTDNDYGISVPSIRNVIKRLIEYNKIHIKKSYSVQTNTITSKMIENAQLIIDQLASIISSPTKSIYVNEFNDLLEQLFSILPRRMNDVKEFLAKSDNDFMDIIIREQNLLDALSGQVLSDTKMEKQKEQQSILELMGLQVSEVSENELYEIKNHLDDTTRKLFKNAWKVVNLRTEANYKEYVAQNNITQERFLYHGSKTENYWSILCNGMILHSNAIINGAMFGHGLYFAKDAHKSRRYTSLSNSLYGHGKDNVAYLTVFKVATGNEYDIYRHTSKCYSFNKQFLNKEGYDSVYAHKGVSLFNDEIIVYDESAVTIRYLIELEIA